MYEGGAASREETVGIFRDLARNSKWPAVRRSARNTLRILRQNPDFVAAASNLLNEMARTKRAERQLLWLGPVVAAVCLVVLMAVLAGFWRSI